MRQYTTFKINHLEKYRALTEKRKIEDDIISYFLKYADLFKNFSSIFLPLCQFALYLNKHYCYLVSREDANSKDGTVMDFVYSQNDRELE